MKTGNVRRPLVNVVIRVALLGAWLVGSAVPAHAQVNATVFVGAMTAGSPRPAVGVAVGRSSSVVGFEIEYAGTLGAGTPAHSSAVEPR